MVVGNKRWLIGGPIIGTNMALKNNKSLGQHWLKDRFILDEIADMAGEGPVCLEIGPGLGTLTSSLLKRFDRVIAVEYDENLATNLPKSFPGKNLEVVHADFLNCDLSEMPTPYAVAGNIPYYITSPIITKLLTAEPAPERIVLLIQKEVAERIAAQPKNHTFLSISVQNRADVTLGPVVGRELFTPPPKVDSQIIILEPHAPKISDAAIKLAKTGFSSPRKKLVKNLNYDKSTLLEIFQQLNLSPDVRPADLSLEDWQKLENTLAKFNHNR